jgi:hypothetical protein
MTPPTTLIERSVHAAGRGAVGAMAMSGMRTWTVHVGLLDRTPPQAIAGKRRVKGWLRHVPRRHRLAVIEALHWGYGAGGGAAFGLLPEAARRAPWSGPVYGVALWLSFEFLLAPALRLPEAGDLRPLERALLATDHALYGLVLNEGHRRPQE